MFRPKTVQERILHRLKIIQGHLGKVSQMVNDQVYCIDILHQSQAVQKALREVDRLLLEHHLKHCVVEGTRKKKKDELIKEVMEVFNKTRGEVINKF